MNTDVLGFEWERVGKNERIELTVKLGDEPLLVDRLDIVSASARERFVKRLCAERAGIDRKKVDEELLNIASDVQRERAQKDKPDTAEDNQPLSLGRKALADTDGELIELATDFLRGSHLIEKIVGHVGLLGVAGEEDLALALYLIGTSRLLPVPLAGIVMGASSAGKSYVISRVEKLFPPEAVLQAHRLSPKALQHMKPGSLVHRFIVAGERSRKQEDDAAEATRALREMISDGKLSAAITMQVKPGQWETAHLEQDGPIAYVESTTLGLDQIFDEDRTRFVLLSSDESQSQTEAILRQLARAATGEGRGDTPDSVIALHHAAQRLLEARDVSIPFANELAEKFPVHRLEGRRTFGDLLRLTKTIALLHQHQRDKDSNGCVIALPSDYEIVRSRFAGPLGRSLGYELTAGARGLLEVLLDWSGEFTVSDVAAKVGLSDNTARGRIKELMARGQIIRVAESAGRKPAAYTVAESRPSLTGMALPELEPDVTEATEAERAADNA